MPSRPAYFKSKHQPARSEERPSAHGRGYDRHWAKLRKAHLTANPFCVFCNAFATCVDHRVPIVIDPSRRLDPSNLRSACDECHNRLTNNFRMTGVNELPNATALKPSGFQDREDGDRGPEKFRSATLRTGPLSRCFAVRF